MAEALLLVSIAIALGRAAKAGLIGRAMRASLAAGAEVELLRELASEMGRADGPRADGISLMALELEATGGWGRLIETAPQHALDAWESTVEVLQS